MSADASDDQRAEPSRYRQWQFLPGRNKHCQLRVQRVQIGQGAACCEPKLVDERLRLKSPIVLERVRPGSDLAAPEIENAASSLACPTHHFPIHEIVGGEAP